MNIDEIPDTPLVASWRRDDNYGGCQQVCSEINAQLLRNSGKEPAYISTLIAELDLLFKHNALPPKTTLFRACARWTVETALKTGGMIYPAFLSTSNSSGNAALFLQRIPADESPIFLHLEIESETPTIDARSRVYDGIGEGEFILPRNLKLTLQDTIDAQSYRFLVSVVS